MTKRLLDFNPLTGEKVWFQYSEHDDQMAITHEQDVTPALEIAHYRATDGDYSRKGIKEDWWHYAKVPNTIILKMKLEDGVDFFDKNDARRMFQLLNTKYKAFKMTSGNHSEWARPKPSAN